MGGAKNLLMQEPAYKAEIHETVLLNVAADALLAEAHLKKQPLIIDATLGMGGHALALLKRGAWVLGIDADQKMLEVAEERLSKACPPTNKNIGGRFQLSKSNFRKIDQIASQFGFDQVDGILFDLGVTNYHLMSEDRGFSFNQSQALLDMRLDVDSQGVNAADLINVLDKKQLHEMFLSVMDYKASKHLTEEIVRSREGGKIQTVGELNKIIDRALPWYKHKKEISPYSLPYLALRIVVGSELENLKEALPKAFKLLKPKGRLVVISFHSGEDSIVKRYFLEKENNSEATIITKKPTSPNLEEIKNNPRSRSAKMRILEKI
jgi:16S rRNA (cytosine1402-N4)-methyltransferase